MLNLLLLFPGTVLGDQSDSFQNFGSVTDSASPSESTSDSFTAQDGSVTWRSTDTQSDSYQAGGTSGQSSSSNNGSSEGGSTSSASSSQEQGTTGESGGGGGRGSGGGVGRAAGPSRAAAAGRTGPTTPKGPSRAAAPSRAPAATGSPSVTTRAIGPANRQAAPGARAATGPSTTTKLRSAAPNTAVPAVRRPSWIGVGNTGAARTRNRRTQGGARALLQESVDFFRNVIARAVGDQPQGSSSALTASVTPSLRIAGLPWEILVMMFASVIMMIASIAEWRRFAHLHRAPVRRPSRRRLPRNTKIR